MYTFKGSYLQKASHRFRKLQVWNSCPTLRLYLIKPSHWCWCGHNWAWVWNPYPGCCTSCCLGPLCLIIERGMAGKFDLSSLGRTFQKFGMWFQNVPKVITLIDHWCFKMFQKSSHSLITDATMKLATKHQVQPNDFFLFLSDPMAKLTPSLQLSQNSHRKQLQASIWITDIQTHPLQFPFYKQIFFDVLIFFTMSIYEE